MVWPKDVRRLPHSMYRLIAYSMRIFVVHMVRTGRITICITSNMGRKRDEREPVVRRCKMQQRSIMALITPVFMITTIM